MTIEEKIITEDGKSIKSREKYKGIKRFIGQELLKTSQNTPLVSGFLKIEASKVIELKNELKNQNKNVTYTSIFIKLLSKAVEEHINVNAALVDQEVLIYDSINVGFAVGTPDELLYVPVIKNTETKDIFEISDEMKELTNKVLTKTLNEEDLSGGTISLSSMGMYDTWGMNQILVSPQAAIFGFGSINKEPIVLENDEIGIGNIIYVSHTVDHRVLQGEPIVKLTITLKEYFQNPKEYMGLT